MIGVSGPSSVHEGETITLTCRYDLGRDAIYSMKWYKNKEEIYRYVPTDNPEYKTFPLPGIEIDSTSTRPNQLVMRITGPLASGQYKCEITVETPSFVTLHRSHNLTVVGKSFRFDAQSHLHGISRSSWFVPAPPKLAPKITGIDSNYRIGDQVEVFCTSKDSKPAASLNWRINGKPVSFGSEANQTLTAQLARLFCSKTNGNEGKSEKPSHYSTIILAGVGSVFGEKEIRGIQSESVFQASRRDLVPEKITLNESSGLETSQLGLRFTAAASHFNNGELRLICGAEIEGVWKTHVEGVALGGGTRTEADVAARSGLQEAKSTRDLTRPNHLLVRNR
eukprot:TCALIF_11905-PA protein Name:"Protein of unknown function" AED:0.13 eAED:0.19 QI:17/0.25/0/1/0.5/0.4/5/0/336